MAEERRCNRYGLESYDYGASSSSSFGQDIYKSCHAPSMQPAQTKHNNTSQQQRESNMSADMKPKKSKHKKTMDAKPARSRKRDASTDSASETQSQSTMAQDMVGSSFAPGDYKDLFQKEKDLQPVSITTPIMSSNQQANNTSKTIFGLPTAPATPQPEDMEKSSHPLQVFSFDKKPEKETCASKSFFGLSSEPKTHTTSALSSLFHATSATKTSTGSLFDFTPKMGDKVPNEKPIS
jgi:hypothetical protein